MMDPAWPSLAQVNKKIVVSAGLKGPGSLAGALGPVQASVNAAASDAIRELESTPGLSRNPGKYRLSAFAHSHSSRAQRYAITSLSIACRVLRPQQAHRGALQLTLQAIVDQRLGNPKSRSQNPCLASRWLALTTVLADTNPPLWAGLRESLRTTSPRGHKIEKAYSNSGRRV